MITARDAILRQMKDGLQEMVDEWLGNDIPDEGDAAFETWQRKLVEIEDIESIEDVIAYLEKEQADVEGFFACGDYAVVTAGLEPSCVPLELVMQAGELLAEQTWRNGSSVAVYEFDETYFVINDAGMTVAASRTEALRSAGIDQATHDTIVHTWVAPS